MLCHAGVAAQTAGEYDLQKMARLPGQCFFKDLFKKKKIMRSILYILAVILIIGWLLGVFVYSAKGLIHILLVLAIISLLVGIIRRGGV